jgi:hypothetical protein
MDAERTINLTDKPLCEFKDGDTLYVTKTEGGYPVDLLCAFRGLNGPVVIVDVIDVTPDYRSNWKGKRTTTVARKCWLWGPDETNPRDSRCHWFKSLKTKAE